MTALWVMGTEEHLDALERNVLEKLIADDIHYFGREGAHAMARIRSLRGDVSGSRAWFERARLAASEREMRPLLAILDHDEAWALQRAGASASEVAELARRALPELEAMQMDGWAARARQMVSGARVEA